MNEQLVQEVLDRLDKAGDLAVEGFGILIRQVYIEALMMGIWVAPLLVTAYVTYRCVRNFGFLGGEHVWATGGYDEPGVSASIFAIIGASAVFVSFGLVVGIVARLANPEFYALRQIMSSVG